MPDGQAPCEPGMKTTLLTVKVWQKRMGFVKRGPEKIPLMSEGDQVFTEGSNWSIRSGSGIPVPRGTLILMR